MGGIGKFGGYSSSDPTVQYGKDHHLPLEVGRSPVTQKSL